MQAHFLKEPVYEVSQLVAFYGRYVAAMEQYRSAEGDVANYWWGEVLREHQGLVDRAPKYQDDSDPTLIHIFLPAKGRQGATFHLPRYQIYVGQNHKTTIRIFDEGEFKDIPDFDEELIDHPIRLTPDGKGAALLYGEPVIQY